MIKINHTLQLIRKLQEQNDLITFQQKKQEIIEQIDLKILDYEIKTKKIIKDRISARKKLAENHYCNAKNYFNPFVCSVLLDIIKDCNNELTPKNVGVEAVKKVV